MTSWYGNIFTTRATHSEQQLLSMIIGTLKLPKIRWQRCLVNVRYGQKETSLSQCTTALSADNIYLIDSHSSYQQVWVQSRVKGSVKGWCTELKYNWRFWNCDLTSITWYIRWRLKAGDIVGYQTAYRVKCLASTGSPDIWRRTWDLTD